MPADAAALITLLRHGSRSPREYVELVEDAGSALTILEQEQLVPDTTQAITDIERWRAAGLQLHTILDSDYPENLRGVHDRPPLIFTHGQLTPADARSIAVIGGRKPTPCGLNKTVTLTGELIAAGFTIVSGLAAGIDTAAHRTALESGRRTIAVVGTGLAHAYPPENARLQEAIGQNGAVISQFWPEELATRKTFPLRNATMSGLSLGTVIVEAAEHSGTRIQAASALRHGRPVFLLESLARTRRWAQDLARKPGVHVIRTAAEVVETIERLTATTRLTA